MTFKKKKITCYNCILSRECENSNAHVNCSLDHEKHLLKRVMISGLIIFKLKTNNDYLFNLRSRDKKLIFSTSNVCKYKIYYIIITN